jgi:hypothetical protein
VKYSYIEHYKKFRVLIVVESIGDEFVRVSRLTVLDESHPSAAAFDLMGATDGRFDSIESAIAEAASRARAWIDKVAH